MKLKIAVAALAASTLAGCSGLKDALNAHTDWVARGGNAELTVTKLAALLGKSRAPVRKDIAKSMANVWVDYQLLGYAAAHNDSLNDPKTIDEVMWPAIANMKARKWYQIVSKSWGVEDTAAARRQWEAGQILAAEHILLLTQGMNETQKADVKKKADALRTRVTAANFAATARASSQDQGSARNGGSSGAFAAGPKGPGVGETLVDFETGGISPAS